MGNIETNTSNSTPEKPTVVSSLELIPDFREGLHSKGEEKGEEKILKENEAFEIIKKLEFHEGEDPKNEAEKIEQISGVKKFPWMIECEYKEKCMNPNCVFMHDRSKRAKCKWDQSCKNPKCTFVHTKEVLPWMVDCKFGENCKNIKCVHKHNMEKRMKCKWGNNCMNKMCTLVHCKMEKRKILKRSSNKKENEEKSIDDIKHLDKKWGNLILTLERDINSIKKKIHVKKRRLKKTLALYMYNDIKKTTGILQSQMKELEGFKEESGKYFSFTKNVNLKNRELKRFQSRLPILALRGKICKNVKENHVLIFQGETGSGKSTQIGQYLLDDGYLNVVCTQPRKISVIGLNKRVGEEYGEEKGVIEQFDKTKKTKLLFTTDKRLLNEVIKDPLLSNWDVVIVDEAHERTIETDLLFYSLKNVLKQRKDFRVVISSATIDTKIFQNYFCNCFSGIKIAIMHSKGRLYPVISNFLEEGVDSMRIRKLSKLINGTTKILLKRISSRKSGHVIVFLSGFKEIKAMISALKMNKSISHFYKILPLHGRLDMEEQQEVFKRTNENKLIISTNIAETSITIDGVKCVIDSGLAKEVTYSPETGIQILEEKFISQASSNQRKGRAGRTGNGEYFALFSKREYDSFHPLNIPEIKRSNLGLATLKLKMMNVKDVLKFDFVESPSKESLKKAITELHYLNVIDKNQNITDIGRFISKLNINPALAIILYEGKNRKSLKSAIEFVALLMISDSFFLYKGNDENNKTPEKIKKIEQGDNDVSLVIREYLKLKKVNRNDIDVYCKKNMINIKSIYFAKSIMKELLFQLSDDIKNDQKNVMAEKFFFGNDLLDIISSSFFTNLCIFNEVSYFSILLNETVFIHPSSIYCLQKQKPKFLLYLKVQKTSRTFIKTIFSLTKDEFEKILKSKIARNETLLKRVKYHVSNTMKYKCFKYKSIGPSLVYEKVIGIKGRTLQKLQKEIGCVINYEDGILKVFCSKDEQRLLFDSYLQRAKGELKDEFVEKQVSGEINSLIGIGGRSIEILLPREFISFTFRLKSKEDNARKRFERYGKLRNFSLFDIKNGTYKKGNVSYWTKKDASNCLKHIHNDFSEIDVQGRKSNTLFHESSVVNCFWFRGSYKNFAFVNFERYPDAILFKENIGLFNIQLKSSIPKESINRNTGIKNFSYKITNFLGSYANERVLKREIFTKLKIVANVSFVIDESSLCQKILNNEEADVEIAIILSNFSSYGKVRDISIFPTKWERKKFRVTYENVSGADNCVSKNKELLSRGMYAERDFSVSFSIFSKIYEILKEEIGKICMEESERAHISVKYVKGKSKHASIKITSLRNSTSSLSFAKEKFRMLLVESPVVNLKDHSYFIELKRGKELKMELENKFKCLFLISRKNCSIKLFCKENDRNNIIKAIQKFINERSEYKEEVITFPYFNKVILKEVENILQNNKEVIHKYGTYRKLQLILKGNEDSLSKVKSSVLLLFEDKKKKIVGEKNCSLCLCELIGTNFTLSCCGCEYHKECISQMVKFAIKESQFPIKCPNCKGEEIIIRDFLGLLTSSSWNEMCESSFKHFKLTNSKKYKPCPSTDCPQVYDVDGKENYKCDKCNQSYCIKCQKSTHDGMNCREFESSQIEISKDDLIKFDIRNCPKCNVSIQKNGGCHHMTCESCKSHMCWKCMKVFPSGKDVYDHMGFCN